MKGRTYFVKEIKNTPKTKFAGYKSWTLVAHEVGRLVVADLCNGKERPFQKVLKAGINEARFASAALTDLINNGLQFTVQKYGFTPRFKDTQKDSINDKADDSSKPKKDRIITDGTTDKDKFKPDKNVEDEVSKGGQDDKADPKGYNKLPNKKLTSRDPRRPLVASPKDPRKPLVAKDKVAMEKAAKARRLAGLYKHLLIGKLAKVIIGMYEKYEKKDAATARALFIKGFVKDPRISRTLLRKLSEEAEAEEAAEAPADAPADAPAEAPVEGAPEGGGVIQENVEFIDVPGVVEELAEFMVVDEEKAPEEVGEAITDFVSPDAPEGVAEEIKTEVTEIAEGVGAEEGGAEGDVEGLKEEVSDLEGKAPGEKKTPSAEEMGVETEEEVMMAASKKAAELNGLFQKKLIRALQIAGARQVLNLESKGLMRIKAELQDHLTQPSGRFPGMKEEVAGPLIESAFAKALASNFLDELFASAQKLASLSDEAFVQIEEDVRKLSPLNVWAVTSKPEAGKKNTMPLGRTGSGLMQGGAPQESYGIPGGRNRPRGNRS